MGPWRNWKGEVLCCRGQIMSITPDEISSDRDLVADVCLQKNTRTFKQLSVLSVTWETIITTIH